MDQNHTQDGREKKGRGAPKGLARPQGAGVQLGTTWNALTDEAYEALTSIAIKLMTDDMMISTKVLRRLVEEHGISEFQAKKVIDKANDWIIEFYKNEKENTLERALQRLYDLHDRCLVAKDFSTAAKVLKDINQLTRLHVDRIEVDGSLTVPIAINIGIKKIEDGKE